MFDTERRDGLTRLRREGARWLATGPIGGLRWADAADNLTVPEGFDRTDLASYVRERRAGVGLDSDGPALLTGVEQRHARRARAGPVTVVATAGLSNPAALPIGAADAAGGPPSRGESEASDWRPGTVNLLVGVERALGEGTLAELLATCVEAKAATLSAVAGVPGTTSDAVAVGSVPDAEPASFAGSAAEVGSAARACVRDAVLASLDSRYDDVRSAVADADHGIETDVATETGDF